MYGFDYSFIRRRALARINKQRLRSMFVVVGAPVLIGVIPGLCLHGHAQSQSVSTLRGTVKLQDKLLAGVMVVALSSDSEQQKSCLTNSAGEYEIRALPTADYLVTVGNTPYVLNEAIGGAFKQVEVKDTGVTVLDLELAQGGVITGCVEYTSKQPVVERQVIYERTDSPVQGLSPMSFRSSVTTDDRGCFRLFGLPAGHYRVGIGKPLGITFTNLPLPFSTTYYPGTRLQSDAQTIGLTTGQEYNLGKLVVKADLSTFSVSGIFIDNDAGEKLSTFPFELVRYEGNGISNRTGLTTDEVGEFRIEDLAEGRYRLQPSIKRKNARHTFTPLSFEVVDRDSNGLVVRCTSLTAGLKGEVVINNNASARNQDCTIALQEGDSINPGNANLYRVTLDHGQFNLSGLRRGTYTLVVMPLRPSLQFEQAQVGREVIRSVGPFAILRINLGAGDETVRIFLKER